MSGQIPLSMQLGMQAGENISSALNEIADERALDRILSQMKGNDQESSDLAMRRILSQVSPERQGNALQFLQNRQQMVGAQNAASQKQLQADQTRRTGIGALDQLERMVGDKGIGFGSSRKLTEEGRYNIGRFSSLTSSLIPIFKQMFGSRMSEKEYLDVQKRYLPKADDSEATIKGKIAGLRNLFENPEEELESSGITISDSGEEMVITEDIVDKLIAKHHGDANAAREEAIQMGYKF